MNHKIIVFVKQVPDTKNVTGQAMKPDGTINRAALPAIFNPEDLNALELALELKDRYQATVTVAAMGLPAAAAILRDSLCRGADEAVLLTDRALGGSDTLATSFALSRLAKTIGGYDLILCGRQAIDGDTAQVGPQIAEKLALPQISYVQEVQDYAEKTIRAKRAIEGGYEILEAPLPVDGTLFVGFEQTGNDYINLGFDRSLNTSDRIWYLTGTEWQQSILSGSLMLRPAFGSAATVGIGNSELRIENSDISVYPNPAHEVVYIDGLPDGSCLELYDTFGRRLYQSFASQLSLLNYPDGLYLLRVVTPAGNVYTHKLIIHH